MRTRSSADRACAVQKRGRRPCVGPDLIEVTELLTTSTYEFNLPNKGCVIWLYGLVKTRWTPDSKATLAEAGSLSVGLNLVRSTTTLNALGDKRNLENLCTSTVSFFSQVTENIRNVSHDWKRDGLCARHSKKPCYPDFDCPWDMRPPMGQMSSTGGSYSRDPVSRNTERSNSYNSVTDTLIASLERGSCSRHSSSTSKISCMSNEAALAAQMKSNRFAFLTCQSCDSCASRIASQKCSTMQNIDSNKQKKKRKVSYGDVRIIYRAKVNLLKHYNSPVRQNTRAEAGPSSESSFSNSQDNAEDERTDPEYAEGLAVEDSNNLNPESGSAATPETETNSMKKSASGTAFLLTRGTHVFDFEFKLPADLPSSFELPTSCLAGGAAARLCYGLRIEIRNYTARIRHTQQREIIVFRPLELTHFPRLRTILLRGRREQRHVEVLRLFATRLKPRQTTGSDNPSCRLGDRSLEENPSLFSPSISPSSHTSPEKSDRSRPITQTDKGSALSKPNGEICRTGTSNLVAVEAHGASAYFEDVIHVPPLPATGLFGRQNLIQVEYMLILRLRMEGDSEGKQEQRMQIPITVGSDPTRETSFIGSNEVVPCYASFNYASGEVTEYDPTVHGPPNQVPRHLRPVYRYFKPRATAATVNPSVIPPQIESSRSSLIRPDSRVPSESKSSIVMHDTSDLSGSALIERRGTHELQGSGALSAAMVSRSSARFLTPSTADDILTTGYSSSAIEPAIRSAEDEGSSDSPSFPILSRQQYFDNGDRITVNDEEDQGLEPEFSSETPGPSGSPNRGNIVESRISSGNLMSSAMRSDRWLHSKSSRKQYSFDLCSDHTVSGDEGESISPNGLVEDDAYLSDEDPICLNYTRGGSDSSSTSDPEEVANFDSCEELDETRFSNHAIDDYYSPQHSTHSGPSTLKRFAGSAPLHPQVEQRQRFESTAIIRSTDKMVHTESKTSICEKTGARRAAGRILYQAYWNNPKVAPVPGRRVEQGQYWTVLKDSEQHCCEPVEFSLRTIQKSPKSQPVKDVLHSSLSKRKSLNTEVDLTGDTSGYSLESRSGYVSKNHRSTLLG
ncbi:unnamed protein product [Echinostoma caproni]|uniref:Arrestin_N domain-containing protein n=1 Tax=Echinostoma caproni TaxID=27848 RepID=A0A183A9D8_9TREM|nr:unnamed protein product [Echinostoma caproni]